MLYLGGVIHRDGRATAEIGRKLGVCMASFKKLSRVWGHASLGRARKLEIFNALIVSKLRYGTTTLWLNKAERAKLDGFHCRCLRRIAGIPSAYLSRISNDEVRKRTGQLRLSDEILRSQLLYLGRVCAPDSAPVLKRAAFHADTFVSTTSWYVRRVGRPRQTWVDRVKAEAIRLTGSSARFEELIVRPKAWAEAVHQAVIRNGRVELH